MAASIKVKTLVQKWDSMDKWIKRILGAIAAAGTIIGLVTSAVGWATAQLDAHLNPKLEALTTQVETLKEQSDAADKKLEQSNTRLELTTLMMHSPENVLEIERVARYYFIDLNGDWYMSKIYSDWAREYGGDISFITHRE